MEDSIVRFADVPTEVVTYVIFDFINRNIFCHPMMCIYMKIESMDLFNCLCINDYICWSRHNTILYSMLSFFTIVESKLLKQAGLEKAQQGSTSIVQNKVQPMIP